MDISRIREDFPILRRKINGKPLIYFDNSATSQKPKQVIGAVADFYRNSNSSVHRGAHSLSQEASNLYDNARERVGKFIGASSREIVFTSGATESLNLLSSAIPFKAGDEILISVMEHHSNMVPWQEAAKKYGLNLKYADVLDNGTLDTDDFLRKLSKKTRVVSLTSLSNVTGATNDIRKIGKAVHDNHSLLAVDATQSVPHSKTNVKRLGCDFLAFSGHKMLAPTGIGALYGKESLLEEMAPFMFGGGMIEEVSLESSTYSRVPWKFEAGTPNIAGAIGLSAAVDYLGKVGLQSIQSHEKRLARKFSRQARERGLAVYGPEKRAGIVPFNAPKIHPHDVAGMLDRNGIAVRSGNHCAQPLMRRLGIKNCVRASFYLYNTEDEVDAFFREIDAILRVMG